MTQLFPDTRNCSLCEAETDYLVIASTNELYPPDLDLRPGEMRRSTMDHWLVRCSGCGYVESPEEPNGSGDTDSIAELVRSPEYREQLEDRLMPELAATFLCRALIDALLSDFDAAGRQALHAAWACDDEETDAAIECRVRALEYWAELPNGPPLEDGPSATQLLLADVARRACRFDEARGHARRGLSGRPDEPIRSLLEFETELIGTEDWSAHSVAEVLG